jgi:hypothetical protein
VGVSENGGIAWKSSSTKAELALVFASEARSFADMFSFCRFWRLPEAGVFFFVTLVPGCDRGRVAKFDKPAALELEDHVSLYVS